MKKLLTAFTALCLVTIGHAQQATVSRTDLAITGVQLSSGLGNAAASNYVQNDGKTILAVKNNNVDTTVFASVVTKQTSLTKEGYATVTLSDVSVTIPSSSLVLIGPFPQAQFNQTAGTVRVNINAPAKVSLTSVRMQ